MHWLIYFAFCISLHLQVVHCEISDVKHWNIDKRRNNIHDVKHWNIDKRRNNIQLLTSTLNQNNLYSWVRDFNEVDMRFYLHEKVILTEAARPR